MDALLRWLDAKKGRTSRLGEYLGMTRTSITMMRRNGGWIPARHIEKINEFTGIPLRYLVRKMNSGLTEGELIELDQIARVRELKELEARAKERENNELA